MAYLVDANVLLRLVNASDPTLTLSKDFFLTNAFPSLTNTHSKIYNSVCRSVFLTESGIE